MEYVGQPAVLEEATADTEQRHCTIVEVGTVVFLASDASPHYEPALQLFDPFQMFTAED